MTPQEFLAKVDQSAGPDACWPWTGALQFYGYGWFLNPGWKKHRERPHHIKAHRFAWFLANGEDIPEGLVIMHDCDNPPCCNPMHLSLGTVGANTRQALRHGRFVPFDGRSFVGEDSAKAVINEAIVREARALARAGLGARAVSRQLGAPLGAIIHLLAGRTWKHVPHEKGTSAPVQDTLP